MDKIKSFLRTLKRIHFWLICPTIVILGLVAWLTTVSWLKKDADKKRSKINGLYTSLQGISNEFPHPNQNVHDGMELLISKRRDEVAQAWTEKWNQQTSDEAGILTWPQELKNNPWGPAFLREVEELRPIEKKVPFPIQNDLLIVMRRGYRDYIGDELPKLAAMIGAEWLVGERAGARRTQNGQSVSNQSIVDWNPANQKEILQNHFVWKGGSISSQGTPNKLDILYAQEDLWVLRSIMKIIQRTNKGATTRFNAAVKEIDSIKIGKAAAIPRGHISQLTAAYDPNADPRQMQRPSPGGIPPRSPGGEPPGMGPAGGRGLGGPDPAEGRYVDKDYQSLDAARLRQVMTAESVEPPDAYLAVAKRVPVRMRLKIDQTKLNLLLVECASAELTVEVRQLRLNPDDSRSSPTTRMASPQFQRPGGGGPPQEDFRQPRIRDRSTGRRNRNDDDAGGEKFNYDITVELYGIVYIYNPVDNKILGQDEETDGAAETADSVAAIGN